MLIYFHDAYIVISLPDIYSSVYFPSFVGDPDYDSSGVFLGSPYEFRWVDHLGTNLIRQINHFRRWTNISTIFRRIS